MKLWVGMIFVFFSFVFCGTAFAEKVAPVEVSAKTLKSKIKIGDEIRFFIQVTHPRKFMLEPLEKLNLSPFEVKGTDAPIRRGQNRVIETLGFTLTAFELGDLKIPEVVISYRGESGELGQTRTEPVPVKVVSVGKKIIDKEDIRTIKGPASTGLTRFKNGLLGLVAGLLAAILIFLIVKRVIRERKEAESRKPPHERILIELGRLKEEGYLEDKKYKEYYSEFSDVLRRYLERALKLEVFDRTTSELAQEMKDKNIELAVTEKVRIVLEESDLVKFAKLEPERALADRLENELRDIIILTRPAGAKK